MTRPDTYMLQEAGDPGCKLRPQSTPGRFSSLLRDAPALLRDALTGYCPKSTISLRRTVRLGKLASGSNVEAG